MASITLQGNIAEPELRFTSGGKAVLNLSVADTLRRKNQAGEWEDVSTTWWRVQVWDRAAETLAEHLAKGSRVTVTGEVHAREWEDREGNKRTSYDVTARTVGIIPKANTSGQQRPAPRGNDPWSNPAGNDAPPPF